MAGAAAMRASVAIPKDIFIVRFPKCSERYPQLGRSRRDVHNPGAATLNAAPRRRLPAVHVARKTSQPPPRVDAGNPRRADGVREKRPRLTCAGDGPPSPEA